MTRDFSIQADKKPNYQFGEPAAAENNNNGNVVDDRASKALSGEGSDTAVSQNVTVKPLKARDLDYSPLGKDNMTKANKFAERSLNEVKDLVRDFNADFPAKPYAPDYEDFPRPEQYTQFKKKDDRYYAWEDSVAEWVEDCKQDMKIQRSMNLGNMANLFAAKIDRNFIASCSQFGILQQTMFKMFEEVQGDMQKFNEAIRLAIRAAQEAGYAANAQGAMTRDALYNATGSVHAHIDDATNYTVDVIEDATNFVAEQIYEAEDSLGEQLDDIESKIDKTNEKLAEDAEDKELRKEIFIGLNNAPKHILGRVKTYLERKGYKFDDPLFTVTPIKENGALKGVIDNLSLEDLKEIRAMMKKPSAADPFVH